MLTLICYRKERLVNEYGHSLNKPKPSSLVIQHGENISYLTFRVKSIMTLFALEEIDDGCNPLEFQLLVDGVPLWAMMNQAQSLIYKQEEEKFYDMYQETLIQVKSDLIRARNERILKKQAEDAQMEMIMAWQQLQRLQRD